MVYKRVVKDETKTEANQFSAYCIEDTEYLEY